MCEPGNVVVPEGRDEDLSLMLESSECLAVQNTVAVSLKIGAQGTRLFIDFAAFALCGPGRVSREGLFAVFKSESNLRL